MQSSQVNAASSPTAAVKTLSRGLNVLRLFVKSPTWTQSEIASATGWSMPTVHRLCSTLVAGGFLEREAGSNRLRCGVTVLELANTLLAGLTLLDVASEHLQALADTTAETANLGILVGGDVVFLRSAAGKRVLSPQVAPGLRLPAYSMAIGKCLLAQLDAATARDAIGPEPYIAHTKFTITTWRDLSAELERIRAQGIAESSQEYELGLDSLAVPIPPVDGGHPSAISVSPPTTRATAADRRALTQELHRTAEAIATSMQIHSPLNRPQPRRPSRER